MSQKFLHTKIIKAASDDFHAVVPGLPPNETKMSRYERGHTSQHGERPGSGKLSYDDGAQSTPSPG
jgi:hypothetical protein